MPGHSVMTTQVHHLSQQLVRLFTGASMDAMESEPATESGAPPPPGTLEGGEAACPSSLEQHQQLMERVAALERLIAPKLAGGANIGTANDQGLSA